MYVTCTHGQVRHRVESVVCFSNDYVEELQKEQRERYRKNFKRKPKEFRSSTERQVEAMLAMKSEHSCSRKLRNILKNACDELRHHCGATSTSSVQQGKDLGVLETIKKMVKILSFVNSQCKDGCHADGGGGVSCENGGGGEEEAVDCVSLRQLITKTMIRWASVEIHNLKLVEEVFSLLYRQFNEIGEVVQALKKTYVLEVIKDSSTGKPNFDIPGFCYALGSLRLLLSVGMGKKEEDLLKDSLR